MLYSQAGDEVAYADAQNGFFEIRPPGPGTYTLEVRGYGDLGRAFHGGPNAASATPITVGRGESLTGIDVSLPAASGITGTVTVEGAAAADIEIDLYSISGSPDDPNAYVQYWESTWTATDDGSYAFNGLSDGTYLVRTRADGAGVDEWYDDATEQAAATVITVADGQRVTGIDFDLTRGGSISGAVTGPAGADAIVDVIAWKVTSTHRTPSTRTWTT